MPSPSRRPSPTTRLRRKVSRRATAALAVLAPRRPCSPSRPAPPNRSGASSSRRRPRARRSRSRSGRRATSSSGRRTGACSRSRATRRSRAASSAGTARAGTSWRRSAAAPATPRGSPGPGRPSSGWSANRACRGAGSGLALCRFKDGQVVGSWSTRVDAADPFRQMMSATCNGPDDCWFGGIGSQDPLGERVGAFHLHWNGTDLPDRLRARRGAGSAHGSSTTASSSRRTLVGRSPENRTEPVDLAEPEPVPRLIHRVGDLGFDNDPFEPAPLAGVPGRRDRAAGPRQRRHRTSGPSAAGRRPGPSAPPDGAVARPPLAARLVGDAFQEVEPERRRASGRPTASSTSPRSRARTKRSQPWSPSPTGDSVNSKATVARIAADGTTTHDPPARSPAPAAAAPPGSPARRRTTAGWSPGPAGSSTTATGRRSPRDTDPAFQGTIEFRPNESAEQFIPDRLPVDDSQLFAPPPLRADPEKPRSRSG